MGSTYLSTVYATDEDVYNESSADWGTIVPKSNRYAAGTDGTFTGGAPWVLTSASSLFASQGVVSGQVVRLHGPAPYFNVPQFLAIDSATDNGGLALRRCGFVLAEGMPPGPAGGLNSVSFEVLSLKPQIERTAYELDQRYAVDPFMPNRQPANIYDMRVFRRLTALHVLYTQYAGMNRSKAGDFSDKVSFYKSEYQAALESATVRWGAMGTSQPPTGALSCKICR